MDNKEHDSKLIEHPMEELFDIPRGSTEIEVITKHKDVIDVENVGMSDGISSDEYDNKDNEVDSKFQEIYDAAMTAYESQMEESLLVEGRFKARNSEVAVQFLNTALSAAKEKAGLKTHKDKLAVSKGKLNKTINNNNLIIADRNDILRNILKDDKE